MSDAPDPQDAVRAGHPPSDTPRPPVQPPDQIENQGSETWPRVPGEYVLGGADSPVAVCTLASRALLPFFEGRPEVAIAGRLYTENVGIEKMVENLLANPSLRILILCGRESRHRVGQAILSLHRNGVDPHTRRIHGAVAPEPILANLSDAEIAAFQQCFTLVDLIGEQDPERVLERARAVKAGPAAGGQQARTEGPSAEQPDVIRAEPDRPGAWTYDPRGFFLIQVERSRRLLLLEHFGQDRRLRHRLEGDAAEALTQTAIRLGLVSELTHAAYLGRELAKAEAALRLGLHYQQDSPLRP